MAYPYSQGDLLAEKPVYNFSAFKGSAFLEAYVTTRRAWLEALPTAAPAAPVRGGVAGLLQSLCKSDSPAADRDRFFRLLQRFEVTKRLWTEVDARLRPAPNAAPAKVGLYALFALAALRLHQDQSHLSLLNAALKANDIVTSQDPARLDAVAVAVAREGVALELETVTALAGKSGVRL
jgi:hypothetical protein